LQEALIQIQTYAQQTEPPITVTAF
jgi:hypothetical protein